MTDHPFLIIAGVASALSVLACAIVFAALAQGKLDDEAADQQADADCSAEWGEENRFHREAE